jgi:flagellar basal-body rod modification protein FlgD
MSSVSANLTMPAILDSLGSTPSSQLAKSASAKAKAASTASTTSTSSTSIGSTFLSLLATELQNQDPTAPVDSTAMVGQMISLNQLDQLISINSAVGGSSTSSATAIAEKAAGIIASSAALNSASGSATSALSPSTAAATSTLPFDPNTMMPLGYATTGMGTSLNTSINAAPIGFSGSANKTTGGK